MSHRRRVVEVFVIAVAFAVVGGAALFMYLLSTGLSARPEPGAVETFFAQRVRGIITRVHSRNLGNPLPVTGETIAEGRAHFADHCASCHANDGSGNTEMGRGLYPKAPDMRTAVTQDLTDGQLFYIIENGVRLTGMPAWGTGTTEGQEASWKLVHFIRHLPEITPEEVEEMEAMNPRPPAEIREEIEAERFLQGDDVAPPEPAAPHQGHE